MFSKCIHDHIYHVLILDSTAQDTSTLIKTVTSINILIFKSYNRVGVKRTYNKIHINNMMNPLYCLGLHVYILKKVFLFMVSIF